MRTRRIVCSVLTLACTTAAFAADDRKELVGVWRYAGEVDTRPDGSPGPAAALSDAQGFLVYTADGFVFTNIMPKGRRWSADDASLAELRETVSNGTAYVGRYEVDPLHHTVTHAVSGSMEPAYEGERLVREYILEGDALRLMGTFPYAGETIHFTVRWTRVKKE